MTKHTDEYLAELAETLELRDVPTDAIAEIVREVESHVAESGENPVDAFGEPSQYADSFASPARSRGFWPQVIGAGLLGFGGGYSLLAGIIGLLSGSAGLPWLPPIAQVVVGAVGLIALVALIARMAARSRSRERAWRL